MKALYFDCFSGISGDMTIGALLDLGIDREVFKDEMKKLQLEGYELLIERKAKNGIYGTDFTVLLTGDNNVRDMQHNDHSHKAHGSHDHGSHEPVADTHEHHHSSHEHGTEAGDCHAYHNHDNEGSSNCHFHGHEHTEDHIHSHTEAGEDSCDTESLETGRAGQLHGDIPHLHTARNLEDIERLISGSDLKQSVKDFSFKVFREIARAEAKVHNKSINEVHFHEVGAVDSIVDIVGTAICLDLLGVKKVFSSALHEGRGFIQCQHGILPVPVPAVMEMLVNSRIPIVTEDINTELVTPTGLGIIKSVCSSYGSMPAMIIDKIGYGMGKKDTGRFNALRVVLGSLLDEDMMKEEIAVLETNIDDMSPELLGYTLETLLDNGALDVYHTPVYMKKNRPAVLLTVLCKMGTEDRLADIIFRETSTLGIRLSETNRYCMNREVKSVNTRFGEIRVKVASRGDIVKLAPEYEDCRTAAKEAQVPVREVYNSVIEKAAELSQLL